ncbi:MAG: iron-sulfur cluster assembly protein [Sulfurospirillaceae bacterium]|nr:iron-sulfur cluster assembly protein [Sulfurospirillaceae bacterium]
MNEEQKEKIIKEVIENIKTIYDPEIPINLYDLGLIYDIKIDVENNYTYCLIDMTLTAPGCSVSDMLVDQVRFIVKSMDSIDEAYVNLVFDPPWDVSKISEEGKDILAASGTII